MWSTRERREASPLGWHTPRPGTDGLLRGQWGASKMSVRWLVFVDVVLARTSSAPQSWRLRARPQGAKQRLDAPNRHEGSCSV